MSQNAAERFLSDAGRVYAALWDFGRVSSGVDG